MEYHLEAAEFLPVDLVIGGDQPSSYGPDYLHPAHGDLRTILVKNNDDPSCNGVYRLADDKSGWVRV
jgi:hypothetical protein